MKSPFLVGLHYAFQTPDKLYFVLDFLNGGELYFHLRRKIRFDEKLAKFYIAEVILAIKCLHDSGIIYRDLKPENILLDHTGHIKLTDFGLSKLVEEEKQAFTFCGTPEYLAPEIIKGKGHDKSVDWWSLGAILYEMLTGRAPFVNKNKRKILIDVQTKQILMRKSFSPEVTDLLNHLLEKDPTMRLGYGKTDYREIMAHPFFAGLDWD